MLEALTGRLAYPGDVETSAYARLERQPDVPSTVPPGIADLLRAMTAREPEQRPGTPAVIAAFQDLLVDELVRRRAVDPALLEANEGQRIAARPIHAPGTTRSSPASRGSGRTPPHRS